MYKSTAHPASSVPPPAKGRRRTATAVLAGYFDPRPQRDYFTDMANSSDSKNPYDSIRGHGPGILFDVRSQQEKDAEFSREQKRLLKNARRRERDLEKRREKEDSKIKKAQKRAERIRESAQTKAAPQLEEDRHAAGAKPADPISFMFPSGTAPLPISLTRGAPTQGSYGFPGFPSPLHAAPSFGWSPYSTMPQMAGASSSQGPLTYGTFAASPPAFPLRSAPTSQSVAGLPPIVPPVTVSAAPSPSPSTVLPVSPPTPSRSISSNTSRTSSKRPATPDDDMPLAHMHIDNQNTFQMYSQMDADGDVQLIDADLLERSTRAKSPLRAPSFSRETPDRHRSTTAPPSPLIPPHVQNAPPDWSTYPSPMMGTQSAGTTQHTPRVMPNPTPPQTARALPALDNFAPSSTAHRRSALSVLTLTSQPSVVYTPHRPNIIVPPPLRGPISAVMNTSRSEAEPTAVEALSVHIPECITPAPATIESSCLSPLADASPMGGEAIPCLAADSHDNAVEDSRPPSPAEIPATLEEAKQGAGEPLTTRTTEEQELGDIDSATAQVKNNDVASEREESPPPEICYKNKGRASKAMLIIESEDELTELEDLDASPSSQVRAKGKIKFWSSASMSLPGASGSREQSNPGNSLSVPDSSASPTANSDHTTFQRRKRQAAKKGWKGWVEVEVEDEADKPVRPVTPEVPLTFGERRTRSGRHFDG